jgi:hypothetical protein
MKYIVSKQIGQKKHQFEIEGKNLFECVLEANKLSFPDVHKCGLCNSDHLELMARKAQGTYDYTFIKCINCKAELTFGQKKKDDDVFYLRKNNEGRYDWKINEQAQPQANNNVQQQYQQAPQPQQGNWPQQGQYQQPQQGSWPNQPYQGQY